MSEGGKNSQHEWSEHLTLSFMGEMNSIILIHLLLQQTSKIYS